MQVDAQKGSAQQTEGQPEPVVQERSPVSQHPDKLPKNPCEKCDKKFESCMNDWWCWFHKDVCFIDCRIEVCDEIEFVSVINNLPATINLTNINLVPPAVWLQGL